MTAPNISFPQADAIIEQLRAEIHQLIGTEYRDAAIQAWEDAVVARDEARAAAGVAARGVRSELATVQADTEAARDTALEHRNDAQTARDEAQTAAENAQTGAPPGGWDRDDMSVDVREDLSRARSALQDVPDATGEARGVIRLAGDLEGTAQAPRVRGLANKLDQDDAAEAGASPISTPGKIIRHSAAGELVANERPQSNRDAASHMWVTEQIGTRAPSEHRHPAGQIDNLDALIDERAMDLLREVPMLMMWDGQGEWVAPEWASTKQGVLNMATQEIHTVEDING